MKGMKLNGLLFVIIIFTAVICGCGYYDFRTEKVIRTCAHDSSNNITIIVFKESWQNLTINEANLSEIKIIESLYVKKSAVNGSNKFMFDYVKFVGDQTNLTIYLNLRSYMEASQTKDIDAHIDIYLPKNTNHTVEYVSAEYIFPAPYTNFSTT